MNTAYRIVGLCLCALTLLLAVGCSTSTAKPDTKLARPLGRWPNADDLKRLESVKGQSAAGVLKTLGHPKRVERDEHGEHWVYPWLATAVVYFHDGVVTNTFYTAGY
jgi:outer membrane protein assembly factor BamE (lipoprotein component of BamABCDE complex)